MKHVIVGSSASSHVIVIGNEKGGSGKTTIAMHLAVALLNAGQRVATIDLDSRQKSLTHYVDNRRAWARRAPGMLKLPSHYHITLADGAQVAENETVEFERFEQVITTVQHRHDFVVIDTPPNSNFLVRLAHLAADTLVKPLNSSFVDIDVLGTVDPITFAVTGFGHYGSLVSDMRRQRRRADGVSIRWVIVRNRFSLLESCGRPVVRQSLGELGLRLGFQVCDGFAERGMYSDLFPRGLTVLDQLAEIMP